MLPCGAQKVAQARASSAADGRVSSRYSVVTNRFDRLS